MLWQCVLTGCRVLLTHCVLADPTVSVDATSGATVIAVTSEEFGEFDDEFNDDDAWMAQAPHGHACIVVPCLYRGDALKGWLTFLQQVFRQLT